MPITGNFVIDTNGNIGNAIWTNTAKDGTGTAYQPIVDSDGHLQVDVLSGASGGTQYQEDAAHVSGNTGTLALVVRSDTAAQTAGTDGDYCALISDSSGRLHVNVGNTVTVASHAVTNAGTFAVQVDGAALTSLQLIDDAIFAEDVASQAADKGIQVLTVRKDTAAATSGTDGDYQPPVSNARGATWVAIEDGAGGQITSFGGGTQYTEDAAAAANPVGTALIGVRADSLAGITSADGDNVAARMTDKGELYVKHVDAIPVTDNGGSLTVDGTVAVSSVVAGTAATNLGKAEDAAHSSGDTGVFVLAVRSDTAAQTAGTDGDYCALVSDSSGRLHVNVGNTVTVASHAVTNAGTFAVQVDGAALTSLQLIDDVVFAEDTAHANADKGVQVLTVRKDTAAATAGTDGDYQPPVSNARGATWVAIEDGAGGQITSFGGGTQYTEDAAAAANPVGNALILVRADTPAASVSADGDNIAARGTNNGELYVKHIDAISVSGTVAVSSVTTAVVPGTGATNLGKAEDGAHTSGDVGVMALAVRTDTPANRSGTDGDYEPLQVSAGRVWASATITAITPGIGASNLGKADSSPHTANDVGVMALAVRADSPATISGTDGDYEPIQASGGRVWVSSSVTAVVPGTGATNLGKAEDAAHTTGDTGVMALAVRKDTAAQTAGTDGDYCPLITDSTGRLHVNTEMPDAAALADGAANPTSPAVGAFLMRYDAQGATWYRLACTQEVTLLASAARTAETTSADQTNYQHAGAIFYVNISALAATPGIRLWIQGKDSISGNYFFLHGTPTTLTATGQYSFELSPGASTATFNGTRYAGTLPRVWRILVAVDDTDSCTYSVSACLIRPMG